MTAGPPDAEAARQQLDQVPEEDWAWFETGEREDVEESECAVVGSMILSADNAGEAAAILRPVQDRTRGIPQYFSRNARQVVYETILQMLDTGTVIDPGTVMGELGRAGLLHRVGAEGQTGGNFLHSLTARAGPVSYHAPRVLGFWQQRNVALELRSCIQVAGYPAFDPAVHLDEIRQRVEDATSYAGAAALRPQWETVTEVLSALETAGDPGLSTGYPDLDELIGGMPDGAMIVIAARPGIGKTTIALNIADHVAGPLGLPVLFSSLEMREAQLTHRRIAAAASVPYTRLTRHQLDDDDWDRVARAHERLTDSRLYVDDTPGASLAQHRGRLKEMRRRGFPARLSVFDYLQLAAAPKGESRQAVVAELARGARNIARELAIPMIMISALNRSPEGRTDKRPQLTDLRESGEIEGTADMVILLYRPDPASGEIEAIVAKNRFGPTGTVTLGFQGQYSRVVSLAPGWTPAPPAARQAPPPPDRPMAWSDRELAEDERRDELAEKRRRAAAGSGGSQPG